MGPNNLLIYWFFNVLVLEIFIFTNGIIVVKCDLYNQILWTRTPAFSLIGNKWICYWSLQIPFSYLQICEDDTYMIILRIMWDCKSKICQYQIHNNIYKLLLLFVRLCLVDITWFYYSHKLKSTVKSHFSNSLSWVGVTTYQNHNQSISVYNFFLILLLSWKVSYNCYISILFPFSYIVKQQYMLASLRVNK